MGDGAGAQPTAKMPRVGTSVVSGLCSRKLLAAVLRHVGAAVGSGAFPKHFAPASSEALQLRWLDPLRTNYTLQHLWQVCTCGKAEHTTSICAPPSRLERGDVHAQQSGLYSCDGLVPGPGSLAGAAAADRLDLFPIAATSMYDGYPDGLEDPLQHFIATINQVASAISSQLRSAFG